MPKETQKVACPPWTADKWLELAEVCADAVRKQSATISNRPEFAPWIPGKHMASRVKKVTEEMVEIYKARAARAGGGSASASTTASPAGKASATAAVTPSPSQRQGAKGEASKATPKKRKVDDEFSWIVDDDVSEEEEARPKTLKRAKGHKASKLDEGTPTPDGRA